MGVPRIQEQLRPTLVILVFMGPHEFVPRCKMAVVDRRTALMIIGCVPMPRHTFSEGSQYRRIVPRINEGGTKTSLLPAPMRAVGPMRSMHTVRGGILCVLCVLCVVDLFSAIGGPR
jgi:hypothetical protein